MSRAFYRCIWITSFIALFNVPYPLQGQSVSCNNPGSTGQADSAGSVSWSNTSNVTSSDNNDATASLDVGEATQYLTTTEYGFNLPSGSEIDSINVKLEAGKTGGAIKEDSVQIIKNGSIQGTNKGDGDAFPVQDDTLCYCGDKWGLGWSVSDINSSDMGFTISVSNDGAGGIEEAQIDELQICVHYRKFLPITLSEFTSSIEENKVVLQWHTESETRNDYFILQKSLDGEHFTSLQKVNGAGNSYKPRDYNVIDQNPAPGVNYYRLKQVDFDGTVHYSKTIQEVYSPASSALKISQNPAEGKLRFQTPELNSPMRTFRLINLQGKIVYKKTLSSETHHVIELPPSISPGTYLLTVKTPVHRYEKKVVIESSS